MEAIQKRVNLTTELFGSIKILKMLGLSIKLSELTQKMRVAELDLSKRYRMLSVTNTFLSKRTDSKVLQIAVANLPLQIVQISSRL